ncbi:MAG: Ig-like domain-containing protein [Eubacterium sp.]|nr:Ig-like domain-containing protein [Eubacterium sp.]
MKRITIIMLLIFTLVIGNALNVGAASVKIKPKSIRLEVRKTCKLKVVGKNVKKVKFRSENKKIAVVSKKGIVRGKAVGKCKIYAAVYLKKGKKKHLVCKITVLKKKKEKKPKREGREETSTEAQTRREDDSVGKEKESPEIQSEQETTSTKKEPVSLMLPELPV